MDWDLILQCVLFTAMAASGKHADLLMDTLRSGIVCSNQKEFQL
jgi:hypothetical protein